MLLSGLLAVPFDLLIVTYLSDRHFGDDQPRITETSAAVGVGVGVAEMMGRDGGPVAVFATSNRRLRSGRIRCGCCHALPAGGIVGVKGEEIVGDALRLGGSAEDFPAVGSQGLQPRLDIGSTVSKLAVGNPKLRTYDQLRYLSSEFFPRIVGRAEGNIV